MPVCPYASIPVPRVVLYARLRFEISKGLRMTTSTAITEKFVELGHGKTRYFEAGTGYPTILIHGAGFLSGADGWLGVMGPLAERYRVLSIDCLNWGPGDVFNQEFSFAYLVDHVREFMDA